MKRKGMVLNKKHVQMGKFMFSQTIKKLNCEKQHLSADTPAYRAFSDIIAGFARRRSDLKECQKVGTALLEDCCKIYTSFV